jgi:hypothetical protein
MGDAPMSDAEVVTLHGRECVIGSPWTEEQIEAVKYLAGEVESLRKQLHSMELRFILTIRDPSQNERSSESKPWWRR